MSGKTVLLGSPNYDNWRMATKAYLQKEDLWHILSEETPEEPPANPRNSGAGAAEAYK